MQYGSYFELLIYLGNMMATIIAIAYAKMFQGHVVRFPIYTSYSAPILSSLFNISAISENHEFRQLLHVGRGREEFKSMTFFKKSLTFHRYEISKTQFPPFQRLFFSYQRLNFLHFKK